MIRTFSEKRKKNNGGGFVTLFQEKIHVSSNVIYSVNYFCSETVSQLGVFNSIFCSLIKINCFTLLQNLTNKTITLILEDNGLFSHRRIQQKNSLRSKAPNVGLFNAFSTARSLIYAIRHHFEKYQGF